ncbi:MAG: hypothetical protein IIA88_06175, partial [Bacteroidetes bacterium]|nr:hypothetical protein [Bacteroidota bacterium]
METLKTFNSNCAKITAIAFISTLLWSSYLFAQGPVKYPDVNGQNLLQLNDIFEVGSILQVDNLLQPDTSWVGHGKPPKYYMIFADDQGRFYRGPERTLPDGGKSGGVGGDGPLMCNSPTNAWVDDKPNKYVILCPDEFERLGLGTFTPRKILHLVAVHKLGGPIPIDPIPALSHSGIRIENQIEFIDAGVTVNNSWDLEPIGMTRFHIGPSDAPVDEPVMILTKDGNTGLGFISPRYRLHLHRKGEKDVYSYYTNSHTSAILISPQKGEGVQIGMSEFGHAEIRNNHRGAHIRFFTKALNTNILTEKMTIVDDGRVIIGQRQKTGAFNDALLQ